MTLEAPWLLYSRRQRWGFLAVLFLVSTSNYFDRYIIAVLLEPIKREFALSDSMLGLLGGLSFAIFYSVFGLGVARWADCGNRRTIVTLALTVWSLMTLLCGLAQSFWQLFLARVGVGAGESGAIPPGQSLIVDYFPPRNRATALAIFNAASVAGSLLGLGIGGYVAAVYGWRWAFLLAGAPGLVLALVVRLVLAEPRLLSGFSSRGATPESGVRALLDLARKRSFVYALCGAVMSFMVAYGPFVFVPSFLVRVLHASLAEVSITYAAVVAVASVTGTLGGGWLADHLARRDQRWLAWLPAVGFTVAAPLFVLAFAATDFTTFAEWAFAGYLFLTAGGSFYAAIHAVCGSHRRAIAVALVLFLGQLLGGGIGPVATGALSDALSSAYGADGLRYSLMTVTTLLLISGVSFYKFGREMPGDIEE